MHFRCTGRSLILKAEKSKIMVQFIDTTKENLIAARLSEKLDEANLKTIHERIHQIIDKGQKVDFYFEMEDFEGYTLKGFWEDIAFKVDPPMIKKKEKYMEDGEEKEREILVPETIKPMFSKEGFEETFGGSVQKQYF